MRFERPSPGAHVDRLESVPLPSRGRRLTREAGRFLKVATRRCSRARRYGGVPAFVASDYPAVYAALEFLLAADLPRGRWFCEWGCGLGVVACLAAMVGFDAWGIETAGILVEAAEELARDFDLPVEFGHGSYLPGPVAGQEKFAWLDTDAAGIYPEWDLEIADFDVIFAYPWPDEEAFLLELFARHGGTGALLLSHHGDDLQLWRKVD